MGAKNRTKMEQSTTVSNNSHRNWVDKDSEGSVFKDKRLQQRFRKLLEQIWNGVGQTIPFACQDWANTKAAYRFLSNDKVSEKEILDGHFNATKERITTFDKGMILILQDTTEFSYASTNPDKIGWTTNLQVGRDMVGKPILHKKCGILMHSSLSVTDNGLPLGLCAIKFWTRKQFKGANELKRHINPTRISIEEKESYRWLENLKQSTELIQQPSRCIHIGDRESDIYELFVLAKECDTHFLVRICQDRLIDDGSCTIAAAMNLITINGLHHIAIKGADGNMIEVELEIKYHRIKILPPVGVKRKKYPALMLTVIHAIEKETPIDRERIIWKLVTDLPITNTEEAIEKLHWYSLRWKIETFHKILKSGCRAESLKLRTAERLSNLIAIFCIVSWRIFWMTMIARLSPNAQPELALTKEELEVLDALPNNRPNDNIQNKTLSYYLNKVARLGGYMGRTLDPPPGNIVMWRGLSKLANLRLGFNMAMKMTCG
jgi:hypothetical protein